MKRIGFMLMLISLLGCSKESLSPEEKNIVGTWQLKEFCVGPGDGSCPQQLATTSATQTLEFRKDGSFIEKIPQPGQFQTPIVSSGEFRIEGEGRLYFKFDNAGTGNKENHWGYNLAGDRLTILPSICNEGCSYTYQRM
ncbi:lipocalin family protein [Salmonirosea aquatica]|uniref:Lipocalin-like domain-containing protein n=1 Tax=Salmonirosea aquatica TaxID=2654236 RepID=A0A7C9F5K8_9BACT|nr:hypothetical protein [Cytophagaceae bacterium SJW1-29]